MTIKEGFGGFLQQAQKVQEEIQRIQESLGKKTVEATAGGGMVTVLANGKQEILSIKVEPAILTMNDKDMLEDLITAGVNQALKASREMISEEMSKLTGGFGPFASMLRGPT